MPMIRWMAYVAVAVSAMPGALVPLVKPVYKLSAPTHLHGAVFAEGDQVVALSSETINPDKGERRCFLSAWNFQQQKWLLTKPIDGLPPPVSCGTLGYSPFLHRLILIANSDLLLVSPQPCKLKERFP